VNITDVMSSLHVGLVPLLSHWWLHCQGLYGLPSNPSAIKFPVFVVLTTLSQNRKSPASAKLVSKNITAYQFLRITNIEPNTSAEWLAHLLHIHEVLG
jgi:hypothetical protein